MQLPSYLEQLEAESIYILREVAAQFQRPVFLYSVGKDSSTLLRLAQKAFYPAPIPFNVLHVDTAYKFPEMYEFRDQVMRELGLNLIIHRNEAALSAGANPYTLGTQRCCALLKTGALLEALTRYEFDAAIGGARREEERSRAKERVFSFRDAHGQWDPRNQRPELWNLYNGRLSKGESMRVFPLSNWTEQDIWRYILHEQIPIVPLYYARKRRVIVRGSQLIPVLDHDPRTASGGGEMQEVMCRFRSLGCYHCSGAVRSEADTVEKIVAEMFQVKVSERATRIIDFDTDGSMELKKREGYF
jgi:sulfate adenylyltransferase subunit 2